MTADMIIGCMLVAGTLGVLTGLVWWSRRRIDHIANSRSSSAREILKELRGGS